MLDIIYGTVSYALACTIISAYTSNNTGLLIFVGGVSYFIGIVAYNKIEYEFRKINN